MTDFFKWLNCEAPDWMTFFVMIACVAGFLFWASIGAYLGASQPIAAAMWFGWPIGYGAYCIAKAYNSREK